jgi:dihydrofolate synthase / folylpolyglutamate synthase
MNHFSGEPSKTYQAAISYLYDQINFERVNDQPYNRNHYRLSRMERLLVELENPQQSAPIVHIAGSKGKGSVAWLTAECLRKSGKNVGLYTSPHLSALEERIVVNGKPIHEDLLIKAVDAVRPAAERIEKQGHGHATFFELTTAMAWWVFRDQHVDACIIEVGLGGRLDSTNVCWPALSVITSISYDHQAQLGDTLGKIAFEKAGIIKPGVPVVSGAVVPEAAEVIQRIAGERGSMLRELGRDFQVDNKQSSNKNRSTSQTFDYRPDVTRWPTGTARTDVELKLLGSHQSANAGVALAGLDILREHGWGIDEPSIRSALSETQIPGRIQIVSDKPLTILDAAHNEASIAALIETLDSHFPPMNRILVFSASRDKQWKKMLELLASSFDRFVFTQFQNNPRAVPVDALVETMTAIASDEKVAGKIEILSAPTPIEAFQLAKSTCSNDDILVISGSFFLASELMPVVLPRI